MSLLTLVQSVCRAPGLTVQVPNAVATSGDNTILQLMGIANQEGKSLARRGAWQALENEATFTTVATAIQTALAANLSYIINDTIWNRTLKTALYGPLSPADYQAQLAATSVGPWARYRVRGGRILFLPTPTAGQTCVYEYITKAWCTDSTGATAKTALSADSDVSLLDEFIMEMGMVWRWKQGKGLDYAEDFAKYEYLVADALGRDGSKPILDAGGSEYGTFPGVFVTAGSWNL